MSDSQKVNDKNEAIIYDVIDRFGYEKHRLQFLFRQ